MRDYIVAALFAGAAIALFAIMVVSGAIEYNTPNIIDEDFTAKYSRFENYTDKIEQAKDSVSSEGGINVVDVGFGIFQASFAFIGLVLSTFGLIGDPLKSFTADFAVPFQIAGILFTLFSAVIVITIIVRILSSIRAGRAF